MVSCAKDNLRGEVFLQDQEKDQARKTEPVKCNVAWSWQWQRRPVVKYFVDLDKSVQFADIA